MSGMHHPFISDLSDKSIEDLQEAIADLTTKITFAHRTQNGPMINQLDMIMNSYKDEQKKKLDKLFADKDIGDNIKVDRK
jgi:hypothetical protein|tara:strand:- start:2289 stop:2528 length:240 start_codon:yes stop_codon:yes gene_type:complete